jgi:tRNA nucleotidyltransferase/poly(A) polymerase
MFFTKKKDTIEILIEKCEKDFNTFLKHLNQSKYRAYNEFKDFFKEDLLDLMAQIYESNDDEITIQLLEYLNKQLEFINKYPININAKDLAEFYQTYYPYQEKIEQLIGQEMEATF